MDKKNIHNYIAKYLTGKLDREEKAELNAWLKISVANKRFFLKIINDGNIGKDFGTYRRIDENAAYENFRHYTGKSVKRIGIRTFLKYAAVVIAVLSISIPAYKLYFKEETLIVPGKTQAVLLNDEGVKVELDSVSTQQILLGDEIVATNSNGSLAYSSGQNIPGEVKYNTLFVPRGGEYKITLSDGTKVHLNADSKLKYPVRFTGDTREVELTGEGYFEIAKDKHRPFYVKTNKIKIKQYGTAFNVYSRDNMEVDVVLVHGSVSLIAPGNTQEYKIKPSELAIYSSLRNHVDVQDVDIEPYVAWHEGKFVFDDKPLAEIMETLSLWYDFDIQFKSPKWLDCKFTGRLSRNAPIEDILSSFEFATDAHFEIKKDKIIISD